MVNQPAPKIKLPTLNLSNCEIFYRIRRYESSKCSLVMIERLVWTILILHHFNSLSWIPSEKFGLLSYCARNSRKNSYFRFENMPLNNHAGDSMTWTWFEFIIMFFFFENEPFNLEINHNETLNIFKWASPSFDISSSSKLFIFT